MDLARAVTPLDDASSEARDRLLAWDNTMTPDSAAAAIYAVWRESKTNSIYVASSKSGEEFGHGQFVAASVVPK